MAKLFAIMYTATTINIIPNTLVNVLFSSFAPIFVPKILPPIPHAIRISAAGTFTRPSNEYLKAVINPKELTATREVPMAVDIAKPPAYKAGTVKNPPPMPK